MKNWNIRGHVKPGQTVLDTLLDIRAITDKQNFLNPPKTDDLLKNFPREFLTSLETAKEIIIQEIAKNTKIIIYGDYDADGICATTILYKTIHDELGYTNVSYFIPNRFDNGYGLSIGAIESLNLENPCLFITVDTGITAAAEAAYIKERGHKLIITDHHQKTVQIPETDCLVWEDSIVGSTVAWLLAKTLGSHDMDFKTYAAIATVTDLFPLLGFNRSLVKEGLEQLNSNPPASIKSLLTASGKVLTEITTYDIGWIIGPRLNASGRLADAEKSLHLLLANNEQDSNTIAVELNEVNMQRQTKTSETYDLVSVSFDNELPNIIVSSHESYHEGIIGLVAAKLSQQYYRPAIVISLNEKFGKGSVRSIPGIDIISVLQKYSHLFVNLGGHPMAAGFTISKENIPALTQNLTDFFENSLDKNLLIPSVNIDLEIPLNIINLNFIKELAALRPFGLGNTEPLFVSKNVTVTSVNAVGKEGSHLALRLLGGDTFYKGIFFSANSYSKDVTIGDKVDIVFSAKHSEYNGKTYPEIVIKDLRKSNA